MRKLLFILVTMITFQFVNAQIDSLAWTGNKSDDWNDALNWAPHHIPDQNHWLYIPVTSNKPHIHSSSTDGICLSIDTKETITIDFGMNLFVYRGLANLTSPNNPDIILGDGTFVTVSNFFIPHINIYMSTNFINLQISSDGSAYPYAFLDTGTFGVRNSLILDENATFNLNARTFITYSDCSGNKGTWDNTAYILQKAGSVINGNVLVTKCLMGSAYGYKYLGSPIHESGGGWTPSDQISDNFPSATSYIDNSYVYNGCSQPSDYLQYDETASDPISGTDSRYGWNALVTGSSVSPMQGVSIQYDYSQAQSAYAPSTTTSPAIDWYGAVNDGAMSYSISYTNNGEAADGLNLVANPYPSPISWQSFWYSTSLNYSGSLNPAIQIWQANNNSTTSSCYPSTGGFDNGQFIVYDPTTPSNIVSPVNNPYYDGTIATGQGFWVQTGSAISLSFDNSIRVPYKLSTYLYKKNPDVPQHIQLSLKGEGNSDLVYLHFGNYKQEFTGTQDLVKLMNSGNSIYTGKKDASKLAIGRFPYPESIDWIPVSMKVKGAGNYSINAPLRNLDANYTAYLVDKLDHNTTEIKTGTVYNFSTAGNDIEGRFFVKIVNNNKVGGVDVNTIHCYADKRNVYVELADKSATNVQVVITDMAGRKLVNQNVIFDGSKASFDASTWTNGIYIVSVSNGTTDNTQKVTIMK